MEQSYTEGCAARECENDDSACPSYLDAIAAETNLDPHFLVALPVDIRLELIEEERKRRKNESKDFEGTNNQQLGDQKEDRGNGYLGYPCLEQDTTSDDRTQHASDPLEDTHGPIHLDGNRARSLLGIGMQLDPDIHNHAQNFSQQEVSNQIGVAEDNVDVRIEVIQEETQQHEQGTHQQGPQDTNRLPYEHSRGGVKAQWVPKTDKDGQVEISKLRLDEPPKRKYNSKITDLRIGHIPAGSQLDPSVLAALPPEIRDELIKEELRLLKEKSPQEGNRRTRCSQPDSVREEVKPKDSPESEERTVIRFVGDFDSSGKMQGRCEIEWKDQSIYKGMVQDGKRSGEGTLVYPNGASYEGNWENDLFHGLGRHTFPDGYRYTGDYNQGKPQGKGRCDFPNGDSYIGHWADGKMCGYGVYSHVNGDVFEGIYDNDKRNGPGHYTFKLGQIDIIMYQDGYRIGEGIRWSHGRERAWLLDKADVIGEVSVDVAMSITLELVGDSGISFKAPTY